MANFKPRYTNANQVKLYLRNKAQYGLSEPDITDSLTTQQINAFINNAESRVEVDLSRQYLIPFVGLKNAPFSTLPQTTQLFIQEMCTWKTVLLILSIYYGQSEGDRGLAFKNACVEQYQVMFMQAAGFDERGQFTYPPLLGMAINPDAAYRSTAGAVAPQTATIGSTAIDVTRVTRGKLTNLNKSLLYGWIFPKP